MNKSMLVGALFGAALATAGGGIAGYQMLKQPDPQSAVDAAVADAEEAATEAAADAGAKSEQTVAKKSVHTEFAEVIGVKPQTRRVEVPREECHDETVTRQKPVKDTHQVTGTVIGAIAGGLLGDKLGGHGSNTGAKVIGAAAGGYAGNKAQERIQQNATYQDTERVCRTVTETQEQADGYDVTYRLNGKTGRVRMDYDPGAAIPVRDGELVLTRE